MEKTMSGLRERIHRMKSCEYWVIAYRKRNGSGNLLKEDRIEGFRLLPQKRFITQADPFLYTHQGKTWLFYEKQNLTDMKGTLWCQNLDEPSARPVKVLEEPFHLSYPQVFRYGKYTYMLPETRNAGEIRLYRCEQFPGRWKQVETLLPLAAVDTTILPAESLAECRTEQQENGQKGDGQQEKLYYLFTYTENRLEIYLCRIEAEHFRLLTKEKIYSSEPSWCLRPGGSFLTEDGKLYRPVQNCTDYYGQELIIKEITGLGAVDVNAAETKAPEAPGASQLLQEKEYCRLSPDQIELPGVRAAGIHTYNRNEQYEVIDILHREISFSTILKKIWWKLKKN